MPAFTHESIKVGDEDKMVAAFCARHGTLPNGLIPDEQFDFIYDHLVSAGCVGVHCCPN